MFSVRSFARFAAVVCAVPLTACLPLDGKAERHLVTSEPTPARLEVIGSFVDVDVSLATANEVGVRADVILKTSGGNETAEREIEFVKVNVVREGDKLVVRQGDPNTPWRFSGNSSGSGRISISLPPNVPLVLTTASGDVRVAGDLGSAVVEISTASGDVALEGLGAEKVVVKTASGDAAVKLVRAAKEFACTTASGDLRFDGGADRVTVSTASGDVSMRGLRGPADIDTASGDVGLWFVMSPLLSFGTAVAVSTASGDVDISLPMSADPSGSMSTTSGNIASEMPIQATLKPGSSFATLSGKGVAMQIRSASGDVTIRVVK